MNKVTSTHVTNVTADNLAEEEFGTIGDGLPGPQRANILLSVFNLIREEKTVDGDAKAQNMYIYKDIYS